MGWRNELPQFQTIDLNQDGDLDLAIYHRISRDITTYLLVDGAYVRSPQFDQVFLKTRYLFILKDFDCDGKKDLFTSTTLGIKVSETPLIRMEFRGH